MKRSRYWIEIEKMDADVKRRAIERAAFWEDYWWPVLTAGLFGLTLILILLNHLGLFPGEQAAPATEAAFAAVGAGTFYRSTFLCGSEGISKFRLAGLLATGAFLGLALVLW